MPITVEQLKQYPNRVLIETGTCSGEGVFRALLAGFQEVRSVELSEHWYKTAVRRLRTMRNVYLYHGTTEEMLPHMLAAVSCPATFWLDAHYAGDGTAKGPKSCPLLEELAIIAQHPVKTHLILIDDLRVWRKEDPEIGFGLPEIVEAVKRINPRYEIEFIDGEVENDILIAKIS